jgi:DNA-binding LacI/PurR family transcriptional regulator
MAQPRRAQITLKFIAERVGVSAMTVSRALSDKQGLVNRKLVEKIRAVAAELGYTPNLIARSLRGEQLPTLVVFAEFISSHQYLAELVDCVSRSVEQRRYGVISCQSSQSLLEALRQFKLAGAVILAPPEMLFYDDRGRPDNKIHIDEPTLVIHSAVEQHFFNEVSPDVTDAARAR